MEEAFYLLWIFWLLLQDLHGGNGGVGLRIDNLLPLVIPLMGSDSDSEPTSDLEAFNSATTDCLAQHSLVL